MYKAIFFSLHYNYIYFMWIVSIEEFIYIKKKKCQTEFIICKADNTFMLVFK